MPSAWASPSDGKAAIWKGALPSFAFIPNDRVWALHDPKKRGVIQISDATNFFGTPVVNCSSRGLCCQSPSLHFLVGSGTGYLAIWTYRHYFIAQVHLEMARWCVISVARSFNLDSGLCERKSPFSVSVGVLGCSPDVRDLFYTKPPSHSRNSAPFRSEFPTVYLATCTVTQFMEWCESPAARLAHS